MSTEPATPMVGRGHVAVPDPLNRYRDIVGPVHAQAIDDAASHIGEELVDRNRDEVWMRRRLEALGRPLDEVSPVRAAEDRALAHRLDIRETVEWDLREEAAILEGLARADPTSYQAAASAAKELVLYAALRRDELIMELDEEPELEFAFGQAEIPPDRLQYANEYLGLFEPWFEGAEQIAIERELAILEQLRAEPAPPSRDDVAADMDALDVKPIGTGRWRPPPRPPRSVSRDEVGAPQVLAELRPFIGAERANRVATVVAPLEDALRHAPDRWVKARYVQLGAADRDLDRRVAREIGRLEVALEAAQVQRDAAEYAAKAFSTSDPELAAAAATAATETQVELDALTARLGEHHDRGENLDDWIASDDHRVLRAVAYENEFRTRLQLEIACGVEESLVRPTERVTAALGDAPDPTDPRSREWTQLARAIEQDRLAREVAQREGVEPPRRHPGDELRLARRVDRFREDSGLEPLSAANLGHSASGPRLDEDGLSLD